MRFISLSLLSLSLPLALHLPPPACSGIRFCTTTTRSPVAVLLTCMTPLPVSYSSVSSIVMLLFYILPVVARGVCQSFTCDTFEGDLFLKVDYSIQCSTPTSPNAAYDAMVAYASIMMVSTDPTGQDFDLALAFALVLALALALYPSLAAPLVLNFNSTSAADLPHWWAARRAAPASKPPCWSTHRSPRSQRCTSLITGGSRCTIRGAASR